MIWESERMLRIKSVVLEILTKLTTTVRFTLAILAQLVSMMVGEEVGVDAALINM